MRKNRVIGGSVYIMSKGGKTTAQIDFIIENEPAIIYLPLKDLIALRDDINDSLTHYMGRMETIKENERKSKLERFEGERNPL